MNWNIETTGCLPVGPAEVDATFRINSHEDYEVEITAIRFPNGVELYDLTDLMPKIKHALEDHVSMCVVGPKEAIA